MVGGTDGIDALLELAAEALGKALAMTTNIYAINLDRPTDRWDALSKQAKELDLKLVRIPAVDGTQIPAEHRVDVDDLSFRRNNGWTMLPGEYGCYRSHLEALATFLESGEHLSIIVEDDIQLTSDLVARVEAAFIPLPDADAIKMFNHRVIWFKRAVRTSLGGEIGRAAHGPLGSSACYAVTCAGAAKLSAALAQMDYPCDIALEKGWASEASIYTFQVNVTTLRRQNSTIGDRAVYKGTKFAWWRKLGTYARRAAEFYRRICYVLLGTTGEIIWRIKYRTSRHARVWPIKYEL